MRRTILLIALFASGALALVLPAGAAIYTGSMGAAGSGAPGCHTSNCGGSSGGSAPWFDIASLGTENINWPATSTLNNYRNQVRTGSKSNIDVAQALTNGMASASPSADPSSFYAIWENNCQDGVNSKQNPQNTPIGARSGDKGCYIDNFNANTFPYYNEIHYSSPDSTSKGGQVDVTVGWNIQIWREGQAKPIFERRIGLNGRSDDDKNTDGLSASANNRNWWYGDKQNSSDRGGRWSGSQTIAGLLGPMTAADKTACKSHQSDAPSSWNSVPVGGGGTENNVKNYLKNQSLNGTSCYWTLAKGEALYIHWSFGGGNASISYKLLGRAGDFYAVHMVAVDGREQLMPGSGSGAFLWPKEGASKNTNFFKVYMAAAPLPPQSGCPKSDPYYPTCEPPQNPNKASGTDEPKPNVDLAVNSPVATRVENDAQVTVTPDEGGDGADNGLSAVFPWQVTLLHFTPQSRYNGDRGSAYSQDYVNYSDPYQLIAPPNDMGVLNARIVASKMTQVAKITEPPFYSNNSNPTAKSVNDFGIAWLRPTLANPCSQNIQAANSGFGSQLGFWPVSSDQCRDKNGNVPRDAWDDYLQASTTYEARWVTREPKSYDEPIGWIMDSPLRCWSDVLDRTVSVGGSNTGSAPCYDRFPISSGADKPQGFINPKTNDTEFGNNRGAAVGIKLNTDQPGSVTDFAIWDATTLQPEDSQGNALISRSLSYPLSTNTVTGNPNKIELWFCTNGIPQKVGARTVKIDTNGAYNDSNDHTVSAAELNDATNTGVNDSTSGGVYEPKNGCGGYVSKWQWASQIDPAAQTPNADNWDNSWDTSWRSCHYNEGTSQNNYTRPNDNLYRDQAINWGAYNQYGSWGIRGSINLNQSAKLNGTVPYVGDRPGGDNTINCSKAFYGHYSEGHWVAITNAQGDPVYKTVNGVKHAYYYWKWYNSGDNAVNNCHPNKNNPDDNPHFSVVIPNTDAGKLRTNRYDNSGNAVDPPKGPNGKSGISAGGLTVNGTYYRTAFDEGGNVNGGAGTTGWWGCKRQVGNSTAATADARDQAPSHVQGTWVLAQKPGPGWGYNQVGPALFDSIGGYTVQFAFTNAPTSAWWELTSTYMGHQKWNWVDVWRSSACTSVAECLDRPNQAQTVAVYGSRLTR